MLNGGTGDDTLYAVGGGSTLNGGDGNDILVLEGEGGLLGAELNGGAGNDILTGHEGAFTGGTGADAIQPGLYVRIDYNSVTENIFAISSKPPADCI